MSILIRGMDMPPKGDYYITLYVCSDGSAYVDVSSFPAGKDTFEAVPAADVRPVVRGEWIKIDKYDNESNVQCSACLEEFDYVDGVCYLCHGYELPLFCPNCGADMRGQKDG